jgi:hypothetical protein
MQGYKVLSPPLPIALLAALGTQLFDLQIIQERNMNTLIFLALPIAAVIHVVEEYLIPGGFAEALSKLLPRASHLFTMKFHISVNGLFLLLCFISAFIGDSNLVLSLSIFGLIFTNAVLHIRGAIINKGYYPGVISGVLLYIPIAIYAYMYFITTAQITWMQAGLSFLLGVLYMAVLMVSVLVQQRDKCDDTGSIGH